MFPHHENEIAQSEAANGKLYAGTWMHCAAVRSRGDEKMSKSLGNFVTIRDILQKYEGEAIRFYLLTSQYRQPLQYSEDALAKAHERLLRLYSALRGVEAESVENSAPVETWKSEQGRRFQAAMSNDFDTVNAISAMTELSKELLQFQAQPERSGNASELARELRGMGAILGILQRDPEEVLRGKATSDAGFEARVEALIAERNAARSARNFARADEIRAELTDLGVVMEDSAGGTTWRVGALVS